MPVARGISSCMRIPKELCGGRHMVLRVAFTPFAFCATGQDESDQRVGHSRTTMITLTHFLPI